MHSNNEKHPTESMPIRDISISHDSNTKAGTKRKRLTTNSHTKRHEDIPWTAARCNRLLRTITSRIAILRRLSENNFADKVAVSKSPARRKAGLSDFERGVSLDPVHSFASKLASVSCLDSPSKAGDPEWFPEGGRKPASKTYSGRGRSRKVKIEEAPKSRDDGTGFRSPFIRRILHPEAADSPSDATDGTVEHGNARSQGRKTALQPRSHAERALRTLLDSFETLLITTTPSAPTSRKGSSSLRDMCLRKVPRYIELEQNWAEGEEEDYDFDATETIYVELENLGSNGSSGLREVVRAHVVKLISDAMDERTWSLGSLDALLEICHRNQAVREGQQILRAWFVKCEGRALNRLEKLVECCNKLGWQVVLFRTLRELLERGQLHDRELSAFPKIWHELLRALARRSSRANAAAFIETYMIGRVRTSCGGVEGSQGSSERMQSDGALYNVAVLMSALCLGEHDQASPENTENSLAPHVHRLAFSLTQASSMSGNRARKDPDYGLQCPDRSVEPFLISSLMLHALKPELGASNIVVGFEALSQSLMVRVETDSQPSKADCTIASRAEFVRDVAKCVAHVDEIAAKNFIVDVTTGLIQLSKDEQKPEASFLRSFAVAIARARAEHYDDNASHDFAEHIESIAFSASSLENAAYTPECVRKPNRFRWEEGLCEWIEATPIASTKKEVGLAEPVPSRGDSGVGLDLPEGLTKTRSSQVNDQPGGQMSTGALRCDKDTLTYTNDPLGWTIKKQSSPIFFDHHMEGDGQQPRVSAHNGVDIDSPCNIIKRQPGNVAAPLPELIEEDSTSPQTSEPNAEVDAQSKSPIDELAQTPIKPTRMLREVKALTQKTERLCLEDACVVERDELAMSPEVLRKSRRLRPAKSCNVPVAFEKRQTRSNKTNRKVKEVPKKTLSTTTTTSKDVEASDDELGT